MIQMNDDTVNPVTADYIIEAIDRAYEQNAQCLIIKMDTPGGLLNSTRMIVKKMLTSKVPVVVYIAPSGSRAGSAGVFITYASHVAAMAPSTNLGAAHPVQMGGSAPRRSGVWNELKGLIDDLKEAKRLAQE
ncbi:MAG: nodulation protein NfeD, partial [Candidatus Omnitrophica bacterium]|nr:nodulation protein NfeD [Candidatus Omnitrophota bacterium]